jgi:aspartyl-tRNA(Asn)/glutamyl-tRNA(Gln) amidotransferase subunit C
LSDPHPLDARDVIKVASLARLSLSDDEVERFTGQLARILESAAEIAALDLGDLAPTAHPLALANVLRDDVVTASLDRDEVLGQAPSVNDNRFSVPKIVGEAP